MTATMDDIDTTTMEITDLEEVFDDIVPCIYPGCSDPAKWRGTLTCGHSHHVCNLHKGMLMAKVAKGPWPCAVNGVMVTDIKWTEL
jgi:hypothetical protein